MKTSLLFVFTCVTVAANAMWLDAIDYRSNCRRKVSANSGSIKSPLYPNPYPANIDCEWIVTAPKGNKVSLTIANFDLQSNIDFVTFYDGSDTDAPLLVNLTGPLVSGQISSSGMSVVLKFVSGKSVTRTHKGFNVDYSTQDKASVDRSSNVNLKNDFGLVQVEYPADYPPDYSWSYELVATHPMLKIFLTIDQFQSDGKEQQLNIYTGDKADESQKVASFSGSDVTLPQTVSTESKMYLAFNSTRCLDKHQIQRRLLDATYLTKCEHTFTGDTGTVQTPFYGNIYKKDCTYLIHVEQGYSVILAISFYHLHGRNTLTIYDGPTEHDTQIMKLDSATDSGSTSAMSGGSSMLIVFKPNGGSGSFTSTYTKF